MSFEFERKSSSDAVFYINKQDLRGRYDPHYYKPEYLASAEILNNIGCTPLGKQSQKIFSGITPTSGGDAYTDAENGIPFIRSGDFFEDGTIDFNDILYIEPDVHEGVMRSSQLKKDDILIAIVGATIGKVGLYQYERAANINQAIAAVRLSESLLPRYVIAFLLTPLGQTTLDRIKRPVARANINLQEVASLPIPVLKLAKQQEVVSKIDSAYEVKKQKEAAAQQLLDGIDDYLLEALGIEKPLEGEGGLQSRVFYRKLSNVTGKRLDAPAYKEEYSLLSQRFEMMPFSQCVHINPITSLRSFSDEAEIGFVPMESVSEKCGEVSYRQKRAVGEAAGYTKFVEGDLIWAKITPCMQNGKSAVAYRLTARGWVWLHGIYGFSSERGCEHSLCSCST